MTMQQPSASNQTPTTAAVTERARFTALTYLGGGGVVAALMVVVLMLSPSGDMLRQVVAGPIIERLLQQAPDARPGDRVATVPAGVAVSQPGAAVAVSAPAGGQQASTEEALAADLEAAADFEAAVAVGALEIPAAPELALIGPDESASPLGAAPVASDAALGTRPGQLPTTDRTAPPAPAVAIASGDVRAGASALDMDDVMTGTPLRTIPPMLADAPINPSVVTATGGSDGVVASRPASVGEPVLGVAAPEAPVPPSVPEPVVQLPSAEAIPSAPSAAPSLPVVPSVAQTAPRTSMSTQPSAPSSRPSATTAQVNTPGGRAVIQAAPAGNQGGLLPSGLVPAVSAGATVEQRVSSHSFAGRASAATSPVGISAGAGVTGVSVSGGVASIATAPGVAGHAGVSASASLSAPVTVSGAAGVSVGQSSPVQATGNGAASVPALNLPLTAPIGGAVSGTVGAVTQGATSAVGSLLK